MTTGIYLLTNRINNKIYVGSALDIDKRWRSHCQQRKFLIGRALNKYGTDCFHLEVLETCSPEILLEREQYYLNTLMPYGDIGYNICRVAGNTQGVLWSDEQRVRQREIRTGYFGTWNKGRKPWNAGKPHSLETKNKISKANKGKPNWRANPTKFRSPNGEIVEFTSINAGSITRNLHVGAMAMVARGERNHHKGWTLASPLASNE